MARAVESSQFDGNCALRMATSSVCPSTRSRLGARASTGASPARTRSAAGVSAACALGEQDRALHPDDEPVGGAVDRHRVGEAALLHELLDLLDRLDEVVLLRRGTGGLLRARAPRA